MRQQHPTPVRPHRFAATSAHARNGANPSSLPPPASSLPRRGLTLIELLVVIVLLLIVTSVAIPVLAPNPEQRRIREAARLVNTFLSGARNRAIQLGRPVGVQFERLAGNTNASMVLSYVEVPAMYAGDTLGAACRISWAAANSVQCTAELGTVAADGTFTASPPPPGLVRQGDLFKANFQGYTYRITGISGSNLTLQVIHPGPVQLPWPITPSTSSAMPYQIIRQPIKASDAPLQLPEGAVVDLNWSGMGDDGLMVASSVPVQVLFAPDGQVAAIYGFDGTMTANQATAPIHFLIGKPEKAITGGDTSAQDQVFFNYQDGNNLWVSIGPQTGLVSTAEVARSVMVDTDSDGTPDTQKNVLLGGSSVWSTDGMYSRGIAKSFQSMGGR